MDSSVVGTSLSKASGLSLTALNSSTSSSGGAQLNSFTLTTAAVDSSSLLLSGNSQPFACNLDSCVQVPLLLNGKSYS